MARPARLAVIGMGELHTYTRPDTRYRIVPKRDFGSGNGFRLPITDENGVTKYGWVKSGWIVTDGFCNVMPAATWFRTIPDAIRALGIWLDCKTSDEFWERVRDR